MEFKIKTEELTFVVADLPEQRRDFETKALRSNEEGAPLFTVRLLAMDGKGSAPIKVGLIGDPSLVQGAFVRPVGLVLNAIDRRGDTVTWWTAERLEPGPMPGGSDAPAVGKSSGKAAGQS